VSVYVDNARIPARVGRITARWSHLTADSSSTSFAPPSRASWVSICKIWRRSRYTTEAVMPPSLPLPPGRPHTKRTSQTRTEYTSPTGHRPATKQPTSHTCTSSRFVRVFADNWLKPVLA
jgi:hypothetical protein